MTSEIITIALVDDDKLVVNLLEQFISSEKGYQVILTAYDGSEFLELINNATKIPDVVIMDLRMKTMNGIETINELRKQLPTIKVITISSHYKLSFMGYMLKLGVNAFLPKGISPQLLLEVIQSVHQKGFYFSEEQIEIMRNQISSSAPAPNLTSVASLSNREIEILELICHQYTSAEIAEKLFITKRTVEGHRNNLLLKTGMKNIAGLVIYAVQQNLIDMNNFTLGTL